MRMYKDIRRNYHKHIDLDESFFEVVKESIKLPTLIHTKYFLEVGVLARWAHFFFHPFLFVVVFCVPAVLLCISKQYVIAVVVVALTFILMYITNKDLKPIRFCAPNQMIYAMHNKRLYVIPFKQLQYEVYGQSPHIVNTGRNLTYAVCINIHGKNKFKKYIADMGFYESIHGFLNYFRLYMRTGKEPASSEYINEKDFVVRYFKKGDNPGYRVCFDLMFYLGVKYNKYLSIRREQWHPQMKIIEEQLERGEIPTPYKEMKVFEPGEIER